MLPRMGKDKSSLSQGQDNTSHGRAKASPRRSTNGCASIPHKSFGRSDDRLHRWLDARVDLVAVNWGIVGRRQDC